ncbi:hypothetical protein BwSF12_75290 [Bradyrhizobium ottawaense]|nr:hypothetical protein BwSF12_75290 [Bradyrhizobium ottawaense]GMO93304.1 hypothetical protein BwSF19_73320 [Bradyrhizobium ottawaense]
MGQKLIDCYDCGQAVSLNASACPSCGSRHLAGPPTLGRKRKPIPNVEAKNDRNMFVIPGTLGTLGALYGIATSSGPWTATLFGIAYGTFGIVVGVPWQAS